MRQEGKEEDRQLGIEDVDQDAGDDHVPGRARIDMIGDLQGTPLAKCLPGHVEQIGDAEILDRLEQERAGVQYRREPEKRRSDMRHDAERRGESRENAGASAARQRRRQRIEHAGAGRRHDDQRGQKEFGAHDLTLFCA